MVKYVVDTSSLINLRQYYPRAAFSALWDRVGSLIVKERMIAPTQVSKELKRKDDDILKWINEHGTMFKKSSEGEVKFATRLAKQYKKMKKRNFVVEKADLYVIALAHHRASETLGDKWAVVTEEGNRQGQIPWISKQHGLDCYKLTDVILKERWSFR